MPDPPPALDQLLRLGRMLELSGDTVSAVIAYREVILAGEATSTAEARRRLQSLILRTDPGRPA
ncbi:MAG: hypothetical protein JOY80_07735 [Candidatus Dormibacteraeota bacterium]|nr:hypothetical protein [Candidatus Dormibacteraeota bacterium]